MKFLLTLVCLSVMARGALADDMDALMQRCAPQVHPKTLSAIVHTESRGRAFVISDDGPMGLPWAERKLMLRSYDPSTKDEAANLVESLTAQGHMVGIGLTQLSSRHLKRFGISVQTALEPCDNLRMGAQVLTEFYAEALKKYKKILSKLCWPQFRHTTPVILKMDLAMGMCKKSGRCIAISCSRIEIWPGRSD
ncbi:transglycosylase SLT domain-containing protein [Undibacterium arcticum]